MLQKTVIISCLFLCWFFSPVESCGQAFDLKFNRLNVDDGLSQSSVMSIVQDRLGFMWFATQDGLNRYDGYEFKTFRHEPGNPNSLSNNYIWNIYEDRSGILWIATFGGGLNRFDPKTETFTHFRHSENDDKTISSDRLSDMAEDTEGNLWIGTDNGINKLDRQSGTFTRYLMDSGKDSEGEAYTFNRASFLTTFENGKIWMLTNGGLTSFNTKTAEVTYHPKSPFGDGMKFGNIHGLGKEGESLLISSDSGLVKLDFNSKIAEILFENGSLISPGKNTNSIFPYPGNDNLYWLSAGEGVILIDKSSGTYKLFTNDKNDPKSLSHNNVFSIFRDNDGITWLGARNGLNRVDKLKSDFRLIQYTGKKDSSLGHSSVGAIIKDKEELLWLGSPEGLTTYNQAEEKYKVYLHTPGKPETISSSYILSLLEDKAGNTWVGTRAGGLNKAVSGAEGRITFESFISKNPDKPGSPATVHYIYEDSKGTIWLGAGRDGVVKFSPGDKSFRYYPANLNGDGPSHNYVYCVLEDSGGNLWMGTASGGVNLFDRKSEKFYYMQNDEGNPKSISNDIILSIFQDSKGNIWIGTSAGLNKLVTPLEGNLFDKLKNGTIKAEFKSYGRKQGFPNEVIYGMLEDGAGYLWVSTNKGLVKFDPEKETVVKTYDVRDGLQNNEFNQNSYLKDEKGYLYFGGIGGLNIFHPDSLAGNPNPPEVVITDFLLFNESVPVNNPDVFSLDKKIQYVDEIDLSYDHDVISFEFASLNYTNPEKNEYAYMMEGFDGDWIYAGDRRQATYTNLDPGTYTFRIKASNNDGVWNEEGTSVIVNIPPPPWLSWYAYLLYGIIFFGAVFLYIRFRVNTARREIEQEAKIERAKIQERETVRKKSSADFHDEAGNKITKISLFTELARRNTNGGELSEYLSKIEENTKELSSGMRDFIWVLDPAKDSLFETLNRIKDFGNSLFDYTGANFSVNGITDRLDRFTLTMDSRRALVLIFKEVINNIVKYAGAKNVVMDVMASGDNLEISISDDGKGFETSGNENGYGLKNIKERAEKIGGNVEIISGEGKGTKVTFMGNITRMGN